MSKPKTGAERIAAERERQVERLTWSPEHDDEHNVGELALAAVCYAANAAGEQVFVKSERYIDTVTFEDPWPWATRYDKRPSDDSGLKIEKDNQKRIKLLVKAGALIAAEIDRELRAAKRRRRKL